MFNHVLLAPQGRKSTHNIVAGYDAGTGEVGSLYSGGSVDVTDTGLYNPALAANVLFQYIYDNTSGHTVLQLNNWSGFNRTKLKSVAAYSSGGASLLWLRNESVASYSGPSGSKIYAVWTFNDMAFMSFTLGYRIVLSFN